MIDNNAGAINYRVLSHDELPRIDSLMRRYGGTYNPELTVAAVADHPAGILGVVLLQMVYHLEPLIILDPTIDFRRLIKPIEYVLPRGTEYYSFAPNDHISRMCRANHMEKLSYQVFKKKVV